MKITLNHYYLIECPDNITHIACLIGYTTSYRTNEYKILKFLNIENLKTFIFPLTNEYPIVRIGTLKQVKKKFPEWFI